MTTPIALDRRLAELKGEFDRAFAAPPPRVDGGALDVLAIRVAGVAYALRITDITAIVKARRIVPLPTRRRDLLGAAGIRGSLTLVFGLASLLGHAHEREEDRAAIRWLALCGGRSSEAVALGFGELDGFARVGEREREGEGEREAQTSSGPVIVHVGGQPRPVVDVPFLLATLHTRTGAAGATQEC